MHLEGLEGLLVRVVGPTLVLKERIHWQLALRVMVRRQDPPPLVVRSIMTVMTTNEKRCLRTHRRTRTLTVLGTATLSDASVAVIRTR
jgi:hypothetical protein